MQKAVLKLFTIIFLFIVVIWSAFILLLAPIFNSGAFISLFSNFVYNSTGNVLYLNNSNFKIGFSFNIRYSADKIILVKENQILNLSGLELNFSPFNKKTNKIVADNVYFQKNGISTFVIAPSTKKAKKRFLPKKIPNVFINKLLVELKTKKRSTLELNFDNISLLTFYDAKVLSFNFLGVSDYLSESLKIRNDSKIYILNDSIYTDNLKLYFFNSSAEIKGKLYDATSSPFFSVVGKNLPAQDIQKCLLLSLKRINPKKYFIENFKNFHGKLDVNLYYEAKNLFGIATLKKIGAKTVPLSIPLFFEKADFFFYGKEIAMKSFGYFGGEPAETDFYLTGLFSNNLEISGNIHSSVTNNFAKKYIEGLFIKGKIFLNVDYYIKNGVVNVIYNAVLDKFSDIYYLKSRLGLINSKREVVAYTEKKGDVITLLKYSYFVTVNNLKSEILMGSGLFTKHGKKFAIDKISLKTQKNAPVSLLGFIESSLKGGKFNGEIEYDFQKSKLDGFILLSKSRFKGFLIEKAAVFASNNLISILSYGIYKGEVYNAIVELENSLDSSLIIYNLDIFLKSYELTHSKKPKIKFKPFFKEIDVKRNINVNKLKLRLDEFKKGNILITGLILNGYVKNNVLFFDMNNANFANGTLGASGSFNFNSKSSTIDFYARNIDAKIASYQVFNLKNHIKGIASAKLKLIIPDGFSTYQGTACFDVKNGALTKFGSKEFLISGNRKKQPFKFSLSKIIKVDKDLKLSPEANIRGFFNFNGPQIQNVNIIVQNNLISFFVEGEYNALTQYSRLNLWGRYDSELEKNVSILHIPLSFIYKFIFKVREQKDIYFEKLLKIPALKNSKDKSKTFNVYVDGNINDTESLKFIFKDIR